MTEDFTAEEIINALPLPEDQKRIHLELLADRDAELHEDLQPYVEDLPPFGKSLRHPLVYEVPLFTPGMANRMYQDKLAALADAITREDWQNVVWLHERPYRTEVLVRFAVGRNAVGEPNRLQDCSQKVRNLAIQVWLDSENLNEYVEDWNHMWQTTRQVFLGDNQEAFDALPDPVQVYRGDIEDGGWSWTTDQKVAEWFAQRFRENDPAPVLRGEVPKKDVIAYITNRGESEIIAPYEAVRNVEEL